jgi:hypothetical protein
MRIVDVDGNEHPINIVLIDEGSEAMRGDPGERPFAFYQFFGQDSREWADLRSLW